VRARAGHEAEARLAALVAALRGLLALGLEARLDGQLVTPDACRLHHGLLLSTEPRQRTQALLAQCRIRGLCLRLCAQPCEQPGMGTVLGGDLERDEQTSLRQACGCRGTASSDGQCTAEEHEAEAGGEVGV